MPHQFLNFLYKKIQPNFNGDSYSGWRVQKQQVGIVFAQTIYFLCSKHHHHFAPLWGSTTYNYTRAFWVPHLNPANILLTYSCNNELLNISKSLFNAYLLELFNPFKMTWNSVFWQGAHSWKKFNQNKTQFSRTCLFKIYVLLSASCPHFAIFVRLHSLESCEFSGTKMAKWGQSLRVEFIIQKSLKMISRRHVINVESS